MPSTDKTRFLLCTSHTYYKDFCQLLIVQTAGVAQRQQRVILSVLTIMDDTVWTVMDDTVWTVMDDTVWTVMDDTA